MIAKKQIEKIKWNMNIYAVKAIEILKKKQMSDGINVKETDDSLNHYIDKLH